MSAFNDIRPANWCFSETFTRYLEKSASSSSSSASAAQAAGSSSTNSQLADDWTPDYYKALVERLVITLRAKESGQNAEPFYHTDWRFNEFLNVKDHAVHATAIELMALPLSPSVVGHAILDLVLTSYVNQDRSTMSQWMNAIGLIIVAPKISTLEWSSEYLLTHS